MSKDEWPNDLYELGLERLKELLSNFGVEPSSVVNAVDVRKVLGLSDFVFRTCQRDQIFFDNLIHDPTFNKGLPEWHLGADEWLDLDEKNALKELRQFRHRYFSTLACQHFLKIKNIEDCMADLSNAADMFFQLARSWTVQFLKPKYGEALDDNQQPVHLIALGMGKLGGFELNFSSDIDLIFCYSRHGQTQGGRKAEDFQIYFNKIAQKIIHLLDTQTAQGQVFRVDMRLRPFGDSGPLVNSFASLENYYQEQGREWERYAMLKARPLGLNKEVSQTELQQHKQLMELLKPFVFRRYIDFGVIESLRTMKQQIRIEVRRRNLINNIKLGSGGIREVEFIVQAMQILRGGKEPQLQQASLLSVLPEFLHLKIFEQQTIDDLRISYLFQRDCEQVLQAIDDQQTQTLPDEDLNKARLVAHFAVASWTEFLSLLDDHMRVIAEIFEDVIGESASSESHANPRIEYWRSEWQVGPQAETTETTENAIESACANSVRQALLEVMQFHFSDLIRSVVTSKGRDRLDGLMPLLMAECERLELGAEQVTQIFKVIKRIASRTTYLTLLTEHPKALLQLIELTASCQFIGDQLQSFPLLLDQLIDPKLLYSIPNAEDYFTDLNRNLLRVEPDDLELQMEILRQFKLSSQLIVAACDVKQIIDLSTVSDLLTALAEAILHHVVNIAWRQMTQRYGLPEGASHEDKQFAVIGYGKLGGLELGYGSDLDVVFVHNCTASSPTTGPKQIDSRQFYLKLAQRIMHICTTRTATGILYDIDTRLRPSGASGLLAINFETFVEYQHKEAWTWEHQALVRTRVVYGTTEFKEKFDSARKEILQIERNPNTLKQEISEMRNKMHQTLAKEKEGLFDLKQSRGGIADIEFITQYLVLAHAHEHLELTTFSDNKRLLKQFVKLGLLSETEQKSMWQAYQLFRDIHHQLSLSLQPALVPEREISAHHLPILEIWTKLNLR